ncbi:MAG: ATP-binding protein [Sulfurimonas sp.]|nr:ATP-binding protein [Sulfurimonas sp.]
MIGLKKITFVNTGRFLYGEVDVSGNTLFTGTNGAGKTTTMQAVLFFYGSSKSDKLGIHRGEGKDNWLKYTYPFMNSYAFYEYEGIYGNTLLMTYANGNQIAYRFMSLDMDLDLKSLVLEDGKTIKEREEILSSFIAKGFKPSSQVISSSKYREILYGGDSLKNDKTFKEFRDFALMKAEGNYDLIHDVQSSIFLSSRVETGSFEKAISNSFGSDETIDIANIKEQLYDSMSDYYAIKVYETQKSLIASIFKEYTQFTQEQDELVSKMKLAVANHKFNTSNLANFEEKLHNSNKEQQVKKEQFDEIMASLNASRDEAKSNYEFSKRELQRAESLKAKYDDSFMQKVILVDSLSIFESNHKDANVTYTALVGEQHNVTQLYDNQLLQAQTHASSNKQALSEITENKIKEIRDQLEEKESKVESDIKSITDLFDAKLREANQKIKEYQELKSKANISLALIKANNPFSKKVDALIAHISKLEAELLALEAQISQTQEKQQSLLEQRKGIERRIEDADISAQERYRLMIKPHEQEIATLQKLLNVSEDTLLHYIRENHADVEFTLTSLLKDQVLYSKVLEPSSSQQIESMYGLQINTQNLEESEYSHANISAKINEQKNLIIKLRLDVDKQLSEKKEELTKAEAKLQKDSFFANNDIEELEGKILKLKTLIVSSKDELHFEVTNSLQAWKDAIKKAEQELTEKVKELQESENTKDELNNIISIRIQKTKDEFHEYKKNSTAEISSLKEKLKDEILKLDTALKAKVLEIEENKTKALLDGGVSKEELHKARTALDESLKVLDKVKQYINEVAVWREDKKFFDKIPQLSEELSINQAKFTKADEESKTQKLLIYGELQALEKKVRVAQEKFDSTKKAIERTKEVFDTPDYKKYLVENKLLENTNAIEAENIYAVFSKISSLLNSNRELYFSLDSALTRLVGKIGNDKHVWFTYKNKTTSETISSIESLKMFMQGGGISQTKELVAKSIKGIQSNISQRYGNLNTQSEKIKSSIDKISKRLSSAVREIPVLDDIGLRYVKSENRILSELQAISEIDIPYGDAKSLFAEPAKSSKSTHLILDRFDKLLDYLKTEKEKEITVADTFSVEMMAVENGKSTGWIMARKQIGSEGTSVIVKTLLYVAMLDTVLSMTRKNTEANVHVLLDEIGKIDQRNMREVIKFANNAGILFLNAAPDVKIPAFYKCIYHYKIINGKTKIIQGAMRQ